MLWKTLFITGKSGNNPDIHSLMDKQNAVYSYNRMLFSHTKERSTDSYYNMDQPWKYYAKWKKPVTKSHTLSYFIYMVALEWENP